MPRPFLSTGVALLFLTGCAAPDYPDSWPSPASAWLKDLAGCPDLRGSYDEAGTSLVGAFVGNPEYLRNAGWVDHQATIVQAADGSWLTLAVRVNEKGLQELEERPSAGMAGPFDQLRLRRGYEYDCSS
jgi:hypothetical protein